jgi:hypothetical protein
MTENNKKFYRWVTVTELFEVFRNGCVQPKKFESNKDSTASSGERSFWWSEPLQSPSVVAVVVTEETPDAYSEAVYWDISKEDCYHKYVLPEATFTRPVKVTEVWVSPFWEGEEVVSQLDDENDPTWFYSEEVQECVDTFSEWVQNNRVSDEFFQQFPFVSQAATRRGSHESFSR